MIALLLQSFQMRHSACVPTYTARGITTGLLMCLAWHSYTAQALLLSDLSYSILERETKEHREFLTVDLLKEEKSFDEVVLIHQGKRYNLAFDRLKKRRIQLPLPPYILTQFHIRGYKKKRIVWQRTISRKPVNDEVLSPIRWLLPYRSFRGALIFADDIARVSADFLEPLSRENAVLLRGLCAHSSTCFLHFPKAIHTSSDHPARDPLGVFITPHFLHYYTTSAGYKKDFRAKKEHPFTLTSSAFLPVRQNCLKRFSSQKFYKLTTQNGWHLNFYTAQQPLKPEKHPCITEEHPALKAERQAIIPMDDVLGKELTASQVHDYHLEGHPTKASSLPPYYALLIKTSPHHVFTQKNLPEEYVLVLNDELTVDGAFAITTRYYSPRLNVAFLPSLEEFFSYSARQQKGAL